LHCRCIIGCLLGFYFLHCIGVVTHVSGVALLLAVGGLRHPLGFKSGVNPLTVFGALDEAPPEPLIPGLLELLGRQAGEGGQLLHIVR
jgi:hypothetical protein